MLAVGPLKEIELGREPLEGKKWRDMHGKENDKRYENFDMIYLKVYASSLQSGTMGTCHIPWIFHRRET